MILDSACVRVYETDIDVRSSLPVSHATPRTLSAIFSRDSKAAAMDNLGGRFPPVTIPSSR